MELIQGYDADGQPLVIPALAVTGALHDISGRDAEAMLRGLEMLDNTMTAALRDAEQAAHLAAVISRTGLSPGTRTSPRWPTPRSARSSPWTPANGGSTPVILTSGCTSSRSPTPRKADRPDEGLCAHLLWSYVSGIASYREFPPGGCQVRPSEVIASKGVRTRLGAALGECADGSGQRTARHAAGRWAASSRRCAWTTTARSRSRRCIIRSAAGRSGMTRGVRPSVTPPT